MLLRVRHCHISSIPASAPPPPPPHPRWPHVRVQAEGVGAGALAAAALASTTPIAPLITWAPGAPVPFTFLVDTWEAIAGTTKRLEIVGVLTAAFRAILASTPGDLLPAVYLCTNRVAPPHSGVELGVGEATLMKVGVLGGG